MAYSIADHASGMMAIPEDISMVWAYRCIDCYTLVQIALSEGLPPPELQIDFDDEGAQLHVVETTGLGIGDESHAMAPRCIGTRLDA